MRRACGRVSASVVLAVFALVCCAARAATVTGEYGGSTYSVSSSDFLQTHVKAVVDSLYYYYNEDNWYNNGKVLLTDGSFGSGTRDSACAIESGTITYYLDAELYPGGFTVTNVDTYSGWQDGGRDDQHYTVSFRKVGASAFTDSVAVDYTDGSSTTFIGKHVNISDLRVENVDAVRFTFPAQENAGAGYMELDVGGEAPTPAYSVNGTSQSDDFTVSGTDLLQTNVAKVDDNLSLYSEGGWTNLGLTDLTDGVFNGGNASCGITGGSVTYWLNTSTSPAGYDITAIDTYAGWANANRDDQRYTVSIRRVGDGGFEDVLTVNYQGTVSQDHVALSSLTLKNVEAIRFTFPNQENSGVGYKELDVTGAPSIASYTDVTRLSAGDQSIVGGDTVDVRITEGAGSLHAITLGANPTVINTLTETTTAGLATVDPASQVLALNGIYLEPSAGGLAIGTGSNNGTLEAAGTTLVMGNASAVAVHAVIADGAGTCSLVKTGVGQLTLDAANTYSGGTLVKTGTLEVATGGSLGSGSLSVLGGAVTIAGGTVAPSFGPVEIVNARVNQTSGSFAQRDYVRIADSALNFAGGSSYIGWEATLGWNGKASTATISGSHVADWFTVRLGGNAAALNLESGGKLYSDLIFNVGGTGLITFDGGTLGMSSRNSVRSWWNWVYAASGTLDLLVRDGGATVDTANGSGVIYLPFQRDGASTGGLTKTGGNTLTLAARSTYAGATAVQGGTLKLSPLPLLVNTGFESPAYDNYGWSYLSSDGVPGGWTMTRVTDNGSGVSHNGGPWLGSLLAAQGSQVCFIQKGASVSQPFQAYVSGVHRLTFWASNRTGYDPTPLKLLIDNAEVATWDKAAIGSDGVFKQLTADFGLSKGLHVIKFQGQETSYDVATVIDDVQFASLDDSRLPGTLPSGTSLSVALGASVDLNGSSLALSGLNGSGLIFNGAGAEALVEVDGDAITEFSGSITGAVSFAKSGSGTLTLSGGSAYTGSTAVSGGTLQFGASVGETIGTDVGYVTGNEFTFSPAANNLLRGLTPTDNSNGSGGSEGTGSYLMLTDGVVTNSPLDKSFYPYLYTVGDNAVITYTVGTLQTGCAISQINIYSAWNDGGRDKITMASISYSTVSDPATFVTIPNSAVDFDGGGVYHARASLKASDGVLATNVYMLRFTFGAQENTWVGYCELEALGVRRPVLPSGTAVTVASGATLDLNGNSQTFAGVSGGGTITGGKLTVNGTIAPGGTNTIGTLTIASTVTLNGTLLIDTALDGTCDLLQVQGGLDLSGLTLQVQDLDQLKKSKEYVIATCAPGGLTGQFISNNLGSKLSICYNTDSGKVSLTGRGLLVTIR